MKTNTPKHAAERSSRIQSKRFKFTTKKKNNPLVNAKSEEKCQYFFVCCSSSITICGGNWTVWAGFLAGPIGVCHLRDDLLKRF